MGVQKQQLAIQVRLNANSNEFSDGAVSSTENHEVFVRRKNNQPTETSGDIVETLKAFREEFKELLQVIFVAGRGRLLRRTSAWPFQGMPYTVTFTPFCGQPSTLSRSARIRFQFCGCL